MKVLLECVPVPVRPCVPVDWLSCGGVHDAGLAVVEHQAHGAVGRLQHRSAGLHVAVVLVLRRAAARRGEQQIARQRARHVQRAGDPGAQGVGHIAQLGLAGQQAIERDDAGLRIDDDVGLEQRKVRDRGSLAAVGAQQPARGGVLGAGKPGAHGQGLAVQLVAVGQVAVGKTRLAVLFDGQVHGVPVRADPALHDLVARERHRPGLARRRVGAGGADVAPYAAHLQAIDFGGLGKAGQREGAGLAYFAQMQDGAGRHGDAGHCLAGLQYVAMGPGPVQCALGGQP